MNNMNSFEYGGDAEQHANYRKSVDFWAKIYTCILFCCHILSWMGMAYLIGKWSLIFPLLNAMLGVFCVEWAWHNTQRIHNVDEERDSSFPEFRRLDARDWNKWPHYPLAMTVMLPLIYMAFFIMIGTAPLSKFIWLNGYNERPILGWRKKWIDVHNRSCNYFFMIAVNMRVKMVDRNDFDYSPWLGPKYKENQKLPIKVATHIAAPHASYLDTTLTQYVENHAFCSKAE